MRGLWSNLRSKGVIQVYCKIHSVQSKKVLAACDKELIGKTLKKGDLDFIISEAFYKDNPVTEEELAKLIDEYENINLVGKKTVNIALKKGLISEKNVIKIAGIPHVQIYRLV